MEDQEYLDALKLVEKSWSSGRLSYSIFADDGVLKLKDVKTGRLYGSEIISRLIAEDIGWVTVINEDVALADKTLTPETATLSLGTEIADFDFDEPKAKARFEELTGTGPAPAPAGM